MAERTYQIRLTSRELSSLCQAVRLPGRSESPPMKAAKGKVREAMLRATVDEAKRQNREGTERRAAGTEGRDG